MSDSYDAVLVLSFGGPEQPDDVIPFLENVLRGRNVPRERLLEVAEHYYHFGGRSPINDQNRALVMGLRRLLADAGPDLPIYFGNRNWHPFLEDTARQMWADGVRCALVLATSAFGSYSGCRQYIEDIARVRERLGPECPVFHKLRTFFNHRLFIEAAADRVSEALAQAQGAALLFTAHSIPVSMAASSPYVTQLTEACRLVCERIGRTDWELVYQSRSGPPGQPWLEPDVNVRLRQLAASGVRTVVAAPIGFLSDHMEVVYDLDTEARATAADAGITLVRAGTVGTHPSFLECVRQLVLERLGHAADRRADGAMGASPNVCEGECCPAPARPPA
jgi:ferrochelatase